MDTEYLSGEGVRWEDLNSFAIARMLDHLAALNCTHVFRQLSARFFAEFRLRMRRLHADTTTISFYGEYNIDETALSEEERKAALRIVRGYNKDGRPQCKQVVVGQIVNEYGVPVVSEVMDGNTSDVEWNQCAVGYVLELQMMQTGIRFVTRCPASFEQKLEQRMILKAYQADAWRDVGSLSDEKTAARYRLHEVSVSVCGQETRTVVVQSLALAEKGEQGLARARDALTELICDVEGKQFACAADAENEWARFLEDKLTRLFDISHNIEESIEEKRPRGRPSKEAKPATQITTYRLRISVDDGVTQQAQEYLQVRSCFVLLSNVDPQELDAKGILSTYKGQMAVETSFREY